MRWTPVAPWCTLRRIGLHSGRPAADNTMTPGFRTGHGRKDASAMTRITSQLGRAGRLFGLFGSEKAPAAEPEVCPAVLHVTHYKAGSQWLHKILHACVPDRIVPPRVDQAAFLAQPVEA